MKKLITLLLSLCLLLSACSEAPASSAITGDNASVEAALTVGYEPFGGQFSPFYAEYANDWDVVDMTQLRLLYSDRSGDVVYKGIEGETRPYNGTDYTYYGPADLSVTENEDGTVFYDFTLREDLVFSDGIPVTVDDLIFSLYVLFDPSYSGPNRLRTMPIQGLMDYHLGNITHISGIQRLGDYSLRVVAEEVDVQMLYCLGSVYIAPMHYYGDANLYDYDAGSFGFPKGDLSAIQEKTGLPLGAGPYRFGSYADEVITFEANETYYLGAPKIHTICFQEFPDEKWNQRIEGVVNGALDLGYFPYTTNIFSERTLQALEQGTVLQYSVNEGEDNQYYCLALNPRQMNVGGEPYAEASRHLRQGFATVIAACRQAGLDTARELNEAMTYAVADYPLSANAWLVPGKGDADYVEAYSKTVDGSSIYTSDMTRGERLEAAVQAALGYFEAAGYTIQNGVVTSAPAGAKLEYEVQINAVAMENGIDDPAYHALVYAQEALAEIGMTLNILNTQERPDNFFPDEGECEMWYSWWGSKKVSDVWTAVGTRLDWYHLADPGEHFYQVYYADVANGGQMPGFASDFYCISIPALDELILAARTTADQRARKELYSQCLDVVTDLGCEVPMYQPRDSLLFNTRRIDEETMAADLTAHYTWLREVHLIDEYERGV